MTSQETAVDAENGMQCWCCGQTQPPNGVVELGNHPEVKLCLRCAHFVHQRARAREDANKPSPMGRVRDQLRAGRRLVMRRQWGQTPVIGGVLRWLGSRLP